MLHEIENNGQISSVSCNVQAGLNVGSLEVLELALNGELFLFTLGLR